MYSDKTKKLIMVFISMPVSRQETVKDFDRLIRL